MSKKLLNIQKSQKLFFNSNLYSIHKKKYNLKHFFMKFFFKFKYEGVLFKVFHFNNDTVFY